MKETDIMNAIRKAVSPYAIIFRVNVGNFSTQDGRYISTGVPKGYSDLSGHRISDGRAVYIEVKNETGRPRPEQTAFLKRMQETNAIAGICRSPEEAVNLILNA